MGIHYLRYFREELTMKFWLTLFIVSINTFVIIDGKDKLNPGYADHLATPCIEDNDQNNKYLTSVQPDVAKFFPMSGEDFAKEMTETDPAKYQNEYMKFSEKLKNELQNMVTKDGTNCIKLNFKWAFMIDSILNTEIPTVEDLGGTEEKEIEEEIEVQDRR